MMNDIRNVWVLLTKSKAGDRVYTHGVYLTYDALMAAIEEIESMDAYCEVYNYEQIPLD